MRIYVSTLARAIVTRYLILDIAQIKREGFQPAENSWHSFPAQRDGAPSTRGIQHSKRWSICKHISTIHIIPICKWIIWYRLLVIVCNWENIVHHAPSTWGVQHSRWWSICQYISWIHIIRICEWIIGYLLCPGGVYNWRNKLHRGKCVCMACVFIFQLSRTCLEGLLTFVLVIIPSQVNRTFPTRGLRYTRCRPSCTDKVILIIVCAIERCCHFADLCVCVFLLLFIKINEPY